MIVAAWRPPRSGGQKSVEYFRTDLPQDCYAGFNQVAIQESKSLLLDQEPTSESTFVGQELANGLGQGTCQTTGVYH
jgi:hypothetical protein